MINKTFLKFFAGALAIVALGIGAVWGIGYYRKTQSPEYQVEQYYKELEALYANDTYGGSTPEETLQLFIDALKKGDVDLASRYFVIEEQKKWVDKLGDLKNRDILKDLVADLSKLKLTTKRTDEAFYTLTDLNKTVIVEMILNRNSVNGRWKITEL